MPNGSGGNRGGESQRWCEFDKILPHHKKIGSFKSLPRHRRLKKERTKERGFKIKIVTAQFSSKKYQTRARQVPTYLTFQIYRIFFQKDLFFSGLFLFYGYKRL